MNILLRRLCLQPPDPYAIGKLEIPAFLCVISLGCQTGEFLNYNEQKVGNFTQSKPLLKFWPSLDKEIPFKSSCFALS
jgi:hypothetical protein